MPHGLNINVNEGDNLFLFLNKSMKIKSYCSLLTDFCVEAKIMNNRQGNYKTFLPIYIANI